MKNVWCVMVVLVACGTVDSTVPVDESASVGSSLNTWPCPGTWGAVPNYDGLAGTYARTTSWPAPTGDLVRVTFSRSGVASYWRQGSYVMQTGGYAATPDNPAIGAVLTFGQLGYPTDGSAPTQMYFVAGLNRNALGQVSSLCLGGTANSTWFVITRVW